MIGHKEMDDELSKLARETCMFWRNFCLGQRIPLTIQDRGEQVINDDPEYWNTHSMHRLWGRVEEELK